MKAMNGLFFYIIVITIILSCNSGDTTNTKHSDSTVRRTTTPAADSATASTRTIVFFGNSLTAGYGIEPVHAFPALIGRRLDSVLLPGWLC